MTMLKSVNVARPGRLLISRIVNFQRTIFYTNLQFKSALHRVFTLRKNTLRF
jgi:hypothetical protein